MRKYRLYSDAEVLEEAKLLTSVPGSSTYTVASQLGRPQATVWWHVTHRLPGLDIELYAKVRVVMRKNYRGGGR